MLRFIFVKIRAMDVKAAKSGSGPESDLDQPIWSVISFEQCEASSLTYEEAIEKLSELEKEQVAGLCIVTDEAAARVIAS
jgi:hypothetical protein